MTSAAISAPFFAFSLSTIAASGAYGFTLQHLGSTNPTSEGFGISAFQNSSTQSAIANDLGRSAWEISNITTASQFAYVTGSFSGSQLTELANGFTLTFEARVLQGSSPSIYDSINHYTIGSVQVDDGTRRFQVALGLDAVGDTVVVLPTSIDNGGAGSRIRTPGPSYTLSGLGNGYHTYQLVYSANTLSASLFVDGTNVLNGYAGHTSFVSNSGLGFAANSGGAARYSLVQLTAVPEPAAYLSLLGGLFAICFATRQKSGARSGC